MLTKLIRVMAFTVLAVALFAGTAHAASARSLVKMETSKGDIVIELFPDKAPKTVANFLQYVKDGAYDGTIFHRVVRGFVVQGGGFDVNMQSRRTRASVRNEAKASGLRNTRGSVAMARTGDPHSASNQFYVNTANNDGLDYDRAQDGWGYAVFGQVVDGMRVIDAIEREPVNGRQGVPLSPIIIKKAYVFSLNR